MILVLNLTSCNYNIRIIFLHSGLPPVIAYHSITLITGTSIIPYQEVSPFCTSIPNNNQSNNNTSNNTTQIKNNKKEIKKFNSVNSLTKFYSNSNISHFNNPNQNTMRNLKKNNYGSNFTLVKTPLNVVQSNNKEKSINKETKFKKIKLLMLILVKIRI